MTKQSKETALVTNQAKEIVDSSTKTSKKRKDGTSGGKDDTFLESSSAASKNTHRRGKKSKTGNVKNESLKNQKNSSEKVKEETETELENLMKFHLRQKPFDLKVMTGANQELIKEEQESIMKRQGVIDRLVNEGLVEVVNEVRIISYQLTEAGVQAAASDEYKEDMAKEPTTNEELHARIMKYSYHYKTAKKMLEELIENHKTGGKALSKKQLAEKLGTNTSGPNFFYTLEQLRNEGYVQESKKKTLRLKKKAFVVVPDVEVKPEEEEETKTEVKKEGRNTTAKK